MRRVNSDRDGVVDSVGIYELGTGPSSADTLIVEKELQGYSLDTRKDEECLRAEGP